MSNADKILVESPKGKNYMREQGVNWRTMLRWILRKQDMKVQNGFMWLRIGTSGGLL
jgi:hypothetical protein